MCNYPTYNHPFTREPMHKKNFNGALTILASFAAASAGTKYARVCECMRECGQSVERVCARVCESMRECEESVCESVPERERKTMLASCAAGDNRLRAPRAREREREREKGRERGRISEGVCVCVYKREEDHASVVRGGQRERERGLFQGGFRERERVCVCVRERESE